MQNTYHKRANELTLTLLICRIKKSSKLTASASELERREAEVLDTEVPVVVRSKTDTESELQEHDGPPSDSEHNTPTAEHNSPGHTLPVIPSVHTLSEPVSNCITHNTHTPPLPPVIDECIIRLESVLHSKLEGDEVVLAPSVRTRIERMILFLRAYRGQGYKNWMDASLRVATMVDKGVYLARCLREWSHAFAKDGTLPIRKTPASGTRSSGLNNENIADEIRTVLHQEKFASARTVAQHLSKPETRVHLDLDSEGKIHESTAARWMQALGYSWRDEPKGQYKDGHEREDVVAYRQNVFLPAWNELRGKLRVFGLGDVVIWHHDETTFTTNDRQTRRWVHADEQPALQPKGEGLSLMIADFVSADFGWLRAPDG